MPLPLPSQAHVDSLLTNVSIAYSQEPGNFIADQAAPIIQVEKQSDLYRIFDKAMWLRDDFQLLGVGAEAAETGYTLSSASYYIPVKALSEVIDDQLRANFDAPGDPDIAATENLTQRALISREKAFVTDAFSSSLWGTTTTLAGADQWSDPVGSDPKEAVQTAQLTVLTNTGQMPNTMIVGFAVHQALQRHPLVREQFKYTSAESINEAMLARFFEVDRYLVSKAANITSAENATVVGALVAGKSALICYIPSSPGLMTPSAMYTFAWRGLVGGSNGLRVLNIPMPWKHGNKIEVQQAIKHVITGSDLGYFYASAVA